MQQTKHNYSLHLNSYFRKLTTVTLVAVYVLILAGGIVRSTGSGMGCPDWPKCFGSWVPPTEVGELPEDYQAFYSDYRHQKNVKFARYLDFFGYKEIGEQILADESIKQEEEFNVYKTWTEYVNRLVGVLVGFFIVLLLAGSLKYIKRYPKIFWLSFSCFVLVIFQGWLGSIVVSTNLLQWLITTHMLIAILILAVLTALYYYAHTKVAILSITKDLKTKTALILSLSMVLLIVQIVFGTQVREGLDLVAAQLGEAARGSWVENIGLIFYIHRTYSLLLLAIAIYLFFLLKKVNHSSSTLVSNTKILVILFVAEIATGVIMAYFAVPFWAQPIHLLVGCLLFGWQFYMLMKVLFNKASDSSIAYA